MDFIPSEFISDLLRKVMEEAVLLDKDGNPIYLPSTVASDLKVVQKRFDYIDPDRILCAEEISGKKSKKVADIHKVPKPYNLLNPEILYIICVYDYHWVNLNEDTRKKVLYHELLHIHPDFDGNLLDHDLVDFREAVNKFGTEYVSGIVD